jgi:hypothetical protein
MQGEPEIYCPHCKWRPKAEDRWFCMPRCNASWNTFWTGGVCPKCHYRWLKTQCLSCGEISLHKDWYHYSDGDNESEREQRDIPTTVGT